MYARNRKPDKVCKQVPFFHVFGEEKRPFIVIIPYYISVNVLDRQCFP